ncbi:IucA/IucC family siderophore biosynthesis protein [Metabacillus halosaccharovorans]|uniref:IucA/IucC family protein n=1 Tax=Metabacillus halosaccharovorans TaxID=930124 RepID=UPI0034CFEFBF
MQKSYHIPSNKISNRVKKQLVEAMMYEGLIEYEEVRNGVFHLYGKKRTYCCNGRRSAFDRIRLNEASIFQLLPDDQLKEVTMDELLRECINDESIYKRVFHELSQTIKLCEWNEKHLTSPSSRRHSIYEELESEIVEGHPYHPCFKSRTGFTLDDHEAYGPEAKQAFTLKWTAAKRNSVHVSILEDEQKFWKRELGEEMWQELNVQLKRSRATFEEYTFLPIHPWQWQSLYPQLSQLLATGELILLSDKGDHYRATQSVRTLWNQSNPNKAYLKLPMNMVNTSSLRTISSPSICAAPFISEWLEEILQSDPYLSRNAALVMLKEYAGISVECEEGSKLHGQLGVIWRESIRTYMKEDEEAVPFTALMMIEQDGQLFIDHWLAQYGVENWVERLVEVSVVPVWHLLVAHGIAIEAHAQNMILLHRNGWPTRIVLRDFHESIEYTKEFVSISQLVPDFEKIHKKYRNAPADHYYWMSSVEALRELVMDTLFVFHLSELAYLLEEKRGLNEELFWKKIKMAISNHLKKHPALQGRHQKIQFEIIDIYVESLVTKKLQKEQKEYRHLVKNVFSQID